MRVMEKQITNLLKKHYKNISIGSVEVCPESVYLTISGANYKYVAKRILDNYPKINWVFFEGGWDTHAYSRETLKWAGFKMKEVK